MGQIQRLMKGGVRIACSIQHSRRGGGEGGAFKFRPYESASEAAGDHQNHTRFMATRVKLR